MTHCMYQYPVPPTSPMSTDPSPLRIRIATAAPRNTLPQSVWCPQHRCTHLKDVGKGENLGKGGSLAPARHCINDVRPKGSCIVLNVHCHLAINSNLQAVLVLIQIVLETEVETWQKPQWLCRNNITLTCRWLTPKGRHNPVCVCTSTASKLTRQPVWLKVMRT